MRRLIYVPIIHTEADMGSLAEELEERARVVVGDAAWQEHKEVVRRYWQEITDYWQGKQVAGLKIFQDGMMADGIVGKNIVESLAKKESFNYQIIAQLLENGAELMKTENPDLLKEEYALTRELAQRKAFWGALWALLQYRWQKGRLLKARDAYIVKRINEGLAQGAKGVCFLGAIHQILPDLAPDIEVIPLKDPEKVREYSQKFRSRKWAEDVKKLGDYLTAPIQRNLGEIEHE